MGLMTSFNSWVMGYCGPRNGYSSPPTGALSELAGVPLGSAEQRRATSWRIVAGTDGTPTRSGQVSSAEPHWSSPGPPGPSTGIFSMNLPCS